MMDTQPGFLDSVRSAMTRSGLVVGLAFSLSLMATWLMNVTAYPGFNDFAPWARDVATAFGGAVGVVLAFYARRCPYGFMGRGCLAVSALLYVLGPMSMLVSPVWASPVLALVGSLARSAATPIMAVYLGFALVGLKGAELGGALAVAYAAYYVGMGLLEPLAYGDVGPGLLEGLFVALPLVALGLLYVRAVPQMRAAALLDTQENLGPTNPAPFLLLNHRLYVVVALFQAAVGYATTFGSIQSFPQSLLPLLGVVIVMAACLLLYSLKSIDGLYTLAFACALAGFLLIPGAVAGVGATTQAACNSLCRAGEVLFRMALWIAVASIAARNLVGALPLILMVSGVGGFGFELGALTGHVANYLGETHPDLVFLLVAAIVFGFALCNFVLARTFSFDATVAGVEPVRPVQGLSDEGGAHDYEAVCARMSAEHGLTAREAEVLPFLARGRNVAYIMEELELSRNTIKSYVARVYAKLDVHSHQELIDLVEREAGE